MVLFSFGKISQGPSAGMAASVRGVVSGTGGVSVGMGGGVAVADGAAAVCVRPKTLTVDVPDHATGVGEENRHATETTSREATRAKDFRPNLLISQS